MGLEAKEFKDNFKESSVIGKGGGVVIPFPGGVEEKVEPVKKETSKEYGERIRRRNKKIAWILLGTLPPITTETVLETIHDTGHAEIIPWYDNIRDKVVNGVKSIFVKNQEGEIIGTIPETKPPEITSLPVVSETTPSTTAQETVSPTTETTPQTVEYKGSVFALPEGSEANLQTGEILALVGNPYGVEAKTKIGQCIKDAFELDGKMVNSEALIPPVIEYMQKKIMEENKEFKYALPFYPDKGIKITEIENKYNSPTYTKVLWNEPKKLAISGIPLGAEIYSPVSTSKLIIWQNDEFRKDWYTILFGVKYIGYNDQYDLDYKGNNITGFEIVTEFIGAEIIPPDLKKFPTEGVRALENMKSEIGEPLAKFKENKFLPDPYQSGGNAEFSMMIYSQMSQWDKDKEEMTGFAAEGLYSLLTMGDKEKKEEIIVSFMPANE